MLLCKQLMGQVQTPALTCTEGLHQVQNQRHRSKSLSGIACLTGCRQLSVCMLMDRCGWSPLDIELGVCALYLPIMQTWWGYLCLLEYPCHSRDAYKRICHMTDTPDNTILYYCEYS